MEAPKIPDAVVQQVFTEDLTQHITTIEQRVLSAARLRPMVERLGLAKPGQNIDDVSDGIRASMTIEPVVTDLAQFSMGKKRPGGAAAPVPAFYVGYTASNAREAQQICTELTSMLLEEDLKARQDASQGTTMFLTKQVEDAKQTLDDLDKQTSCLQEPAHGPASRRRRQ